MSIAFGRATHIEKIKLQDCLTYPIWVSAHDDSHDEEMQKPITSTADVSDDVLRVDHPSITFKVDGRQWYGTGMQLMPMLDRRSAACVRAMSGIYRRLLERIEEDPQAVLERRVSLGTATKVGVALRSLVGVEP